MKIVHLITVQNESGEVKAQVVYKRCMEEDTPALKVTIHKEEEGAFVEATMTVGYEKMEDLNHVFSDLTSDDARGIEAAKAICKDAGIDEILDF